MFEREDYDHKLWRGLEKLLKKGSFRIANGKVIRREENFGYTLNGPWVFIRGIGCRECQKWGYYHDCWKIMPRYCAEKCWKVVIGVNTLHDCHNLYNLAKALNYPGKVGINKRSYVKGPYLGFFYSENEDMAKQQKKDFITNLESMGIEHSIIHKQSCTEMTASKAQVDSELESKLDNIFAPIPDEFTQPDWLKSAVMWEWNNFANMIGDPTAIDITVKCEAK